MYLELPNPQEPESFTATLWLLWVRASTELPVSTGVPQESVLGPTLFLIYINNLSQAVSCNVTLYADDTLLYSEVNSNQEKQLFQMNINALHDWSTKWKMPFITNKCEIIAFSNRTQADSLYTLGGNLLRYVQEARYLGIQMQSNLRFDRHISEKIKDASKVLGCIKFTLHEAPEKGKLLAYISHTPQTPHTHTTHAVCLPHNDHHNYDNNIL